MVHAAYGMYGASAVRGKIPKPETKTELTSEGSVAARRMATWAPRLWPMIWAAPLTAWARIRFAIRRVETSTVKGVIAQDLPWPGRSGTRR
jgi:hypothetical protein